MSLKLLAFSKHDDHSGIYVDSLAWLFQYVVIKISKPCCCYLEQERRGGFWKWIGGGNLKKLIAKGHTFLSEECLHLLCFTHWRNSSLLRTDHAQNTSWSGKHKEESIKLQEKGLCLCIILHVLLNVILMFLILTNSSMSIFQPRKPHLPRSVRLQWRRSKSSQKLNDIE